MATRQHLSSAAPWAMLRLWLVLGMTLNALQQPRLVEAAAIDADGPAAPPYDLDSLINQLVYPNPVYQLHASALRSQLRNLLRERQLAADTAAAANENEQAYNAAAPDYDYIDEDKRSVASLAAQGMLHPKRSLATLAKNGQLPSLPDPEDAEPTAPNEDKRYVGALARSGGFATYGKRNIGTLARDYQLPQNGKRNLATLARLGLLTKGDGSKRNLAAVARYNSHGRQATLAPAEKRNIGALKASPVHGIQHKRDEDEVYLPASLFGSDMDYAEFMPNYWLYPSYADLDWGDFGRAQKRFLDTSRNPELFGIENAGPPADSDYMPLIGDLDPGDEADETLDVATAPPIGAPYGPPQQKRHIGAVYRSGFLPTYRSLRSISGGLGGSIGGGGGGRFSRSGRARQFV
ncbi:neuropeptide-like 1 isoform X2 [Zeugodacus cucurbitae]|nr:neuropeptide-like 1 isoform X2 [Zeugodacus cucurbitae]XP_028894941.2 neuropeptide-like 1 isoform X2 [Zeugodacus cucurbitae]